MATALRQRHGDRVRLVNARKATDEEETQYLRDDEPKNRFCPTSHPRPTSGER